MFNRNGNAPWRWVIRIAVLAVVVTLWFSRENETKNMTVQLGDVAEQYVRLALAVGELDDGYIDAYYGPASWRDEAASNRLPAEEIERLAKSLLLSLQDIQPESDGDMVDLRHEYLTKQIGSLRAYAKILDGAEYSFDEESELLYDARAPEYPESRFERILDRLDAALPGEGSLIERYGRFKAGFVIPRDRLEAVFDAALAEARLRTRKFIDLPDDESFSIEYVTDKPWSGYNWYQGSANSLIQINTDLPIYIDRAIDLASHEGYPGHHVYNLLLEQALAVERGWVEFTVYPLFSPQSLIAEGSANFGIEVAFPAEEREEFEREVLCPLAGIDPATAGRYHEVEVLVASLGYAGNEAARRYLNGEIDAGAAARYLSRYALMEPERAAQRVRFIDTYRSYVINYNYGKDLVRDYVERNGGTAENPERRWEVFSGLLASPRLPSGLSAASPD